MKCWDKHLPTPLRNLACRYLSYDTVIAIAKGILNSPFGRRLTYSNARPLFDILDEAGVDYDPHETATRAAMLELLYYWAPARFIVCPTEELERWIRVRGLEHLTSSIGSGRGIMLAGNHLGPGFITKIYLCAKGYPVCGIWRKNIFIKKYKLRKDSIRMPRDYCIDHDSSPGLLRTMSTTRDMLRLGQIVSVAMDGGKGHSNGVRLSLMNRYITFRIGLPLAAASANAVIVPVFATMKVDGHIEIRFEAPYPERHPDQPPLEYAQDIIKRYAAGLQQFWEREPGSAKPRKTYYELVMANK